MSGRDSATPSRVQDVPALEGRIRRALDRLYRRSSENDTLDYYDARAALTELVRTERGALLCDCDVLWDVYVRRGGNDPRAKPADSGGCV